jgi:SAM-dependent methyltransferase
MQKIIIECQFCKCKSFHQLKIPNIIDDSTKKMFNTQEDSQWVLCRGCGLALQNPRYQKEYIESLYQQNRYREATDFNSIDVDDKDIRFSRRTLSRFQWTLDKFGFDIFNLKNTNCLDFGCGIGGAFDFLKENNKLYGIEIDDTLRNYGNKNFNINIYSKLSELDNIQFDFIFTNHALEHVYDPNEFIQFANSNLKDTGVMVIVLPTWKTSDLHTNLTQFNCSHNIMVDHVSLSVLLNKHGFYMSDYSYINQKGSIELITLCVKSQNKNNFTFKLSEHIKEIEENILEGMKEKFTLRWLTGNDSLEF